MTLCFIIIFVVFSVIIFSILSCAGIQLYNAFILHYMCIITSTCTSTNNNDFSKIIIKAIDTTSLALTVRGKTNHRKFPNDFAKNSTLTITTTNKNGKFQVCRIFSTCLMWAMVNFWLVLLLLQLTIFTAGKKVGVVTIIMIGILLCEFYNELECNTFWYDFDDDNDNVSFHCWC